MLQPRRYLLYALALVLAAPLLLAGMRSLGAAPARRAPVTRAPAASAASARIAVPEKGLEEAPDVTQGELRFLAKDGTYGGSCPLKHTDVEAEISGFISRVTVTQQFTNPTKEPIEAVYVFPLPQDAAVDRMTMKVGNRVIRGEIKPREEARQIYEEARSQGKVASLLDQERPNIFTQSIANIIPGEQIHITISYTELLKFQDGGYDFVFPTVVGPRYIPGSSAPGPLPARAEPGEASPLRRGQLGRTSGATPAAVRAQPLAAPKTGPDPAEGIVTDAERIRPPITPPKTRAGHDLSIKVRLDAGLPLGEIRSKLHPISITKMSDTSAEVTLRDLATLPNQDFVLRYEVAGGQVQTGILTHAPARGDGYFTLVFQPPPKPQRQWITPKEMIFVIDTSGSQMGWPIEKAKETMKLCVEQMNPDDTFQMLAFNNEVVPLFDRPQPNNPKSRAQALEFLGSRLGGGGTEMLKAVLAALETPPDPNRLRIVCFMTDGYVGNDFQIISAVKEHLGNARMFVFGIGNSVNRFLLDKMAEEGRGAVEYVLLNTPGVDPAKRFQERIANPLLTDIEVDWGELPVEDVYPSRIPDLFSSGPVVLTGRYRGGSAGLVRLRGFLGGQPWSHGVDVSLPNLETDHDALAPLWARKRIDDLMSQDWLGMQTGSPVADIKEQITQLALRYRLMSQYTSFVAVEHVVVTSGGKTRTVPVPVEMPEGVSYEGIFGLRDETLRARGGGAAYAKGLSARNLPMGAGALGGIGGARPAAPGRSANALSLSRPALRQPAPESRVRLQSREALERLTEDEALAGASALGREKRDASPLDKLHPRLKELVEVTKAGKTTERARLLRELQARAGKVEVSIWLTDTSPKTLAALKALGVEVLGTARGSRMVVALTPVAKLEALAKLATVRRVEPAGAGG